MRIFVYEYTCGSDVAAGGTAESLRAEGRAMLAAVLDDFSRIPDIELHTILHDPAILPRGRRATTPVPAGSEHAVFAQVAAAADYTLVIAPEFDDLLAMRCRWAVEAGSRLLGPSMEAVRLTGDKLASARHLLGHGVPTPECGLLCGERPDRPVPFPAVLKPRHGAGSSATFLVLASEDLSGCVAAAASEGCVDDLLLQPVVRGLPASVAFLIGPQQVVPLLPGEQTLSRDGRFRYEGGRIPLAHGFSARALRLAQQAVDTVTGLRGYVGVDLVLGAAEDGSSDRVIEINPRLTTSYVGLRAMTRHNLAEAMLRTVMGLPVSALAWSEDAVVFRPDGSVEVKPQQSARDLAVE
jgi:predicted ATP-grasp superfamily ATP-dependent carboligase